LKFWIGKKVCLEPGKKGYEDEQDPADLFILPFLVQDNTILTTLKSFLSWFKTIPS